MQVIHVRNVCEALPIGIRHLIDYGRVEPSRAGDVLVAPTPVTTVYARPTERVLTAPLRDANPFFHLAEAVWMLAGRNDSNFLNHYVRDFGQRFAEPEGVIHGAYGHRWRAHFGYDQLDEIVRRLMGDPQTRQCVLQIWDGSDEGAHDLMGGWRDRPCNTQCYFRVRDYVSERQHSTPLLDMMVTCRSNDIIWGAYGANAVHFGFLLEYVAARAGFRPGLYSQMSFNYHMYLSEWQRLRNKSGGGTPDALTGLSLDTYGALRPSPLAASPEWLDIDILKVVGEMDALHARQSLPISMDTEATLFTLRNTFLSHTVFRAAYAYRLWRLGERDRALSFAGLIEAADWRWACAEWMTRRVEPTAKIPNPNGRPPL